MTVLEVEVLDPDTSSSPSSSDSSRSETWTDSESLPNSTSTAPVWKPFSAEQLASSSYRMYWEAAQHTDAGDHALAIVPSEWKELITEVFDPCAPSVEPHQISPRYRTVYSESTSQMSHMRCADDTPSSLLPGAQSDQHIVELSLTVSEASQSLPKALGDLSQWIEECYLPLLRGTFSTNDLIEDVSIHLPTPPSDRLCDDVFEDTSLAVLRTETAHVPAALRLSQESLSQAIPNLPSALAAANSSQLSPRYSDPGGHQQLEIFSTLVDWHPYRLGIQYKDTGDTPPGLWVHGRMAATSPARHLHWLGIHAPVLVVQFDFEKVSFHLNWPERVNTHLRCTSAFVWPPKSLRAPYRSFDFRKWDLRRPAEAIELGLILSNIDRYTSTHFLEQISRRFSEGGSYTCSSRPWKIDVSTLPTTMAEVEGSREWEEEQKLDAARKKVPEQPLDIRTWLEGVC